MFGAGADVLRVSYRWKRCFVLCYQKPRAIKVTIYVKSYVLQVQKEEFLKM